MESKYTVRFLIFLLLMLPFLASAQSDINIQLEKRVDKSSGKMTNLFFDVPIEQFTFSDNIKNPEVAMLSEGDNFKSVYVLRYENEQDKVKYKVDTNTDLDFADEKTLNFEQNGKVLSADILVRLRYNDTRGDTLQIPFQVNKYKEYILGRITAFRQGTVSIGKDEFELRLRPRDRTNPTYSISSGTVLLIDLDNDGTYSKQWSISEEGSLIPSETFSITEPFKIQGKTFEVAEVNHSGTELTLRPSGKDTALVRGFYAPDVKLKTKEGDSQKLYSYLDKPLLLEFWSISCPFCEQVRPDLNELYSSKKKDFNLLVFPRETDSKKINKHLEEHPKEGLFLKHDEKVWDRFNSIGATPTFYLIDQSGVIHLIGRGASLLSPIKQILNDKSI